MSTPTPAAVNEWFYCIPSSLIFFLCNVQLLILLLLYPETWKKYNFSRTRASCRERFFCVSLLNNQNVCYHRMEELPMKPWWSSAVHWRDPPDTQFILVAQGKVLVKSEMLSSCLLPDKLPAPTFTFPATETVTGYSFVFNTVGELLTGEQQISPWNLTYSWFPLHLQTAWPPSQLTAAATLCSSLAGRMLLQHSAFSISPDLQDPPKPCCKLWCKEVKTSTCPEMGQDKESLSKKQVTGADEPTMGFTFWYDEHTVSSKVS